MRWRLTKSPRTRFAWQWAAPVIALAALPVVFLLFSAPTQATRVAFIQTVHASDSPPAITAGPAATGSSLSLGISATPSAICANNITTCPASAATARVTLTAGANTPAAPYWPNVQVAFVIETTAYDGVYYHYYGYPGYDKCALSNNRQGIPCEESNGVPFFIDHAQQIADGIAAANPHSQVSFALVDFFGTDCGDWNDCGDSTKYHVDISHFVASDEFGQAVQATLQAQVFGGTYSGIVGLDDNFLHSPSITALYGTIIGSGLTWSPNTHHVVVLMGSTAPRDPAYVQNYYVSPFDPCCGGTQADGWTCEPAFSFGAATSPNCEGWVQSQDGNPNDSIAALARTSPTCIDSIGATCTIDVIDLWATPTDPLSSGWPTMYNNIGGGPGGIKVQANVDHVLEAGCALARATGGTWSGPAFFACPDGTQGNLQYVPHGPVFTPNFNNPTLYAAFRQIGFGPVYNSLVANGTHRPMFTYVPIANIHVAPVADWQATCLTPAGPLSSCQTAPSTMLVGGTTVYGWNFSTDPARNAMYFGDTWTASFNVIAVGGPFTVVPVDACTTIECRAAGSGAVSGIYLTEATYVPRSNGTAVQQSFPLARVNVEVPLSTIPGTGAPPPPPAPPPGLPIAIPPGTPVLTPIGTVNSVGVANISLQATAAGFLGAGFMRVGLKNRPIALRVAALSGKVTSKFDKNEREASGAGLGRFE